MLIMTIKIDHFDSQASLTPLHSCSVFSFLLLYPKLFSTPLFSSPSPLLSPLQLFYVILSSPLLLSFLLSSSHLLLSFLPSFHHITSHQHSVHLVSSRFISPLTGILLPTFCHYGCPGTISRDTGPKTFNRRGKWEKQSWEGDIKQLWCGEITR